MLGTPGQRCAATETQGIEVQAAATRRPEARRESLRKCVRPFRRRGEVPDRRSKPVAPELDLREYAANKRRDVEADGR